MLLRRRPPRIDSGPLVARPGFEHLDRDVLAVLKWLTANKVDFVLVGPIAYLVRGDADAAGPVAVVPAPYVRNLERLSRALGAEHARLRVEGRRSGATAPDSLPVRLSAEKLARGARWMLRCGPHELDIEGAAGRGSSRRSAGSRYQELLYEAGRFQLAEGVSVEVASPEDLEHYEHLRRTGIAPEMRITRQAKAEHEPA